MDFFKTYMLPVAICTMFLVEGVLAGLVFTKSCQGHDPAFPEDALRSAETRHDGRDSLLRHLSWEAGSEIPPASPLAAARKIEHMPHPLNRLAGTVIVDRRIEACPPTQGTATVFDNPFLDELTQPSPDDGEKRLRSATMLTWNAESMLCEARPCPLNFDAGKSRHSRKDVFVRNTLRHAAKFMHPIELWSRRFHIPPDLVYGIAMTESNFNPTLISSRDAHGLMQVVPLTAGHEVKRWLGESGMPTRKELLDPYVNVKYGTGYLCFLLRQYFSDIADHASREYCAIAAYNSGAAPVLAAFSPKRKTAISVINAMNSDEVLNTLLDRLPIFETRFFIRKVLTAKAYFTPTARQEIRRIASQENPLP